MLDPVFACKTVHGLSGAISCVNHCCMVYMKHQGSCIASSQCSMVLRPQDYKCRQCFMSQQMCGLLAV